MMKAKIVDVTRGGQGQKQSVVHASASSFILNNIAVGVDNPMTGSDNPNVPNKRTKSKMSKAHNPEGQMSERVLGDITNKVVNHQYRLNETKSAAQLGL